MRKITLLALAMTCFVGFGQNYKELKGHYTPTPQKTQGVTQDVSTIKRTAAASDQHASLSQYRLLNKAEIIAQVQSQREANIISSALQETSEAANAPKSTSAFNYAVSGNRGILADIIPTAGATETFTPVAGDNFFDPGGPGGMDTDGAPGNYPNCGCITTSTLAGVSEIQFLDFGINSTFDYLELYDGTSAAGTLLFSNNAGGAQSTVKTLAQLIAANGSASYTAASGNFFFVFRSSTVVNWRGYDVEIVAAGPPPVFPAPYCGPLVFPNVEPITRVNVAGINNTSPAAVGGVAHQDFTAVQGMVDAGVSYPIALEGNTDGDFINRFAVFVDWNQDDDFADAGETYEITNTIINSTGVDGQQATGTIAVPADALAGSTRMRVKKIFGTTNYLNPCLGATFGQAEDYTLLVGGGSGGDNDTCADATAIVCGTTYTGDTSDNTDAGGFGTAPDEWFSFTGTGVAQTVTISLCDGATTYDSRLTVYDSCGGTQIITNDDSCGLQSQLSFSSDGTSTYYIAVEGFGTAAGAFSLAVTCVDVVPPSGCGVANTGTFENGKSFTKNLGRIVAHDVVVQDGENFNLESINLNAFVGPAGAGVTATLVDIYIWADLGGAPDPANLVDSFLDFVPTSQTEVGTAFGFQAYDVELDHPDVMLMGATGSTTTYWVGISLEASDASNTFWENSTAGAIGFGEAYNDGVVGFVVDPGLEGVYDIAGTCSDIGGTGTPCSTDNTGTFENGKSFTQNLGRIVAHDIDVDADGFTLETINLNAFIGVAGSGVNASFVDIYIYADNAGVPGAELDSFLNFTPTSQTVVGSAFGFDAWDVFLDHPDVPLTEGKYWIGVSLEATDASNTFWENSTAGLVGLGEAYDNGVVGFVVDPALEGVYSFAGTCGGTAGTTENALVDFSFAPNPATDFLNLRSAGNIETVSLYNLLGQEVMRTSVNSNSSEINVSGFATGTYIMKVMVDGQIGTYKVIKN